MLYWLDKFTQCLLPFFYQGMVLNPTSCIVFKILRWFNQMGRRINEPTWHSQQAGMTCLGQSCGPRASSPCRVAVWPSIGVQWVNLKLLWGVICKKWRGTTVETGALIIVDILPVRALLPVILLYCISKINSRTPYVETTSTRQAPSSACYHNLGARCEDKFPQTQCRAMRG
jgi:hypothetical protein